ncbi:hypothetical protein VTG60DRAFT_517 [Thermothelomyces hinnuleus]
MYATLELPDHTPLEDDDLPDGELLTSTCGGLLLVDGEAQTVRVVHYTAQEYFERTHVQELEAARLSMANASLAYISLPNFSDGPCATDTAMARRLEQFPFLDYASRYWGVDIGSFSNAINDPVWAKLDSFFSNQSAQEVAWQVQNLPRVRYFQWSQDYPRNVPPLVMAASFDMPCILRRMITQGGHPVDSCGSDQVTALIRASGCGLAGNVRVLVEQGANLEARDFMNQTALQKAAATGSVDAVEALIGAGADVNAQSLNWTTLMSAVFGGNLEVVRRLVEGGADFAVQTPWGETALTIALYNGQEAIASYLIDQGAVLPRNHAGRRASLAASRKGMLQVIRRLEADYRTVAERPLQRHTRIREEAAGSNSAVNGVAVNGEHQELTDPARPEEDDARDLPDWLTVTNGFSKLFEFEAAIGKGHFAEVCKYRNRVTNVAVAVKIFKYRPDARLSRMPYPLRNEVELLRKMQGEPHPAILNLIEVFLDFTRWQLLVVTELADAGDLFTLVVSKGKLSEEETRGVFAQLFSAVEFLHARGWVHRDIKPENILIFDQETLSIKLADFGLAKELPVDSSPWAYNATLCGTPSYVAPEVLAESQTRKCGTPTDIWSCGVVLYICLCGFPPFSDELKTEDFPYDLGEQIRRGLFFYPSPYWDPISDPALDLIDNMIVVDMAERFSARQCLEHPWMTSTGH